MRVGGLFAGIGGIELGLERAGGFETNFLCENDDAARAVLRARFPAVELLGSVRTLATQDRLPLEVDLVCAGFPCVDLSQVGRTNGLNGRDSGLVKQLFTILNKNDVPWVLLENVPFMLQLSGGHAMRYIIKRLERLGYMWAYRVVDTRAFGLPQRRRRVFLLASREENPAARLLATEHEPVVESWTPAKPCGFYWTEGNRGLGWAVDCVPTLKGGSGLGIPSPPAVWLPNGRIVTPTIEDAERLQGFPKNWTLPAEQDADTEWERRRRHRYRWKLVGNAVSVPVSEWIAKILTSEPRQVAGEEVGFPERGSCPNAGFGSADTGRFGVDLSSWPVRPRARRSITKYLSDPGCSISSRAATGFRNRLLASQLSCYPPEFLKALGAIAEQ